MQVQSMREKGRKVEADVAMCPLLSLFRREEHGDDGTYVPHALQNYRSKATPFILPPFPPFSCHCQVRISSNNDFSC